MVLSDSEILKEIESGNLSITPFSIDMLGPNSYDVTINKSVKISPIIHDSVLDCKKDNSNAFKEFEMNDTGLILYPDELNIAHINETVKIPNHLCANIDGKSSLGRLGLSVHVTAGFIDSDFRGQIVLEITATLPIRIYPNMPIAQIKFFEVKGQVLNPYGSRKNSKYQGQTGNQLSQMHKNFK